MNTEYSAPYCTAPEQEEPSPARTCSLGSGDVLQPVLSSVSSPGGGGGGGEADRGGDLEAEHGAGVATDSQY